MIWVTYEEFNGCNWETRMKSCTTHQYESLKRRSDIVIIKVERVNIISR